MLAAVSVGNWQNRYERRARQKGFEGFRVALYEPRIGDAHRIGPGFRAAGRVKADQQDFRVQ